MLTGHLLSASVDGPVVDISYAWGQAAAWYLGAAFPGGSVGKESACRAGDLGLIPGLGRSPGEGKGYPLQCSGLENSMDCIVHGVAKSQIRLNDFHFTSCHEVWEIHPRYSLLSQRSSLLWIDHFGLSVYLSIRQVVFFFLLEYN